MPRRLIRIPVQDQIERPQFALRKGQTPRATNPLIDISSAIDLPIQDATNTNKAGEGDPTYTLSVGSLISTNLDGSVSEQIVASQLPLKQATPYNPIYCNLGDGSFVQNTDTFNSSLRVSLCTAHRTTLSN